MYIAHHQLLKALLMWVALAGACLAATGVEDEEVPPGFENLDAPRETAIEVWYAGRKRGTAFGQFTEQWIRFYHPEQVLNLLPDIADKQAVEMGLQGRLISRDSNTSTGKGSDNVEVEFDARRFRAHLFIKPSLLTVKSLNENRYLDDASSGFSAVQGLSLSLSGARSKDSTDHFSWYGRSVMALDESHMFSDWGYDKAAHFNISSMYIERDWQGQELVGGLFTANSFGLGFSADPQLLGVRLAHSTETLNRSLAINTTPIVVYLPVRGRVEIYRNGRLLDARLLEAGRQQLDTRGFPQGAYNLTIRVYDGTRLVDERQQLYVKSNSLPGASDPLYFIEFGRPMENTADSWWPRTGEGWVLRGGYSRLVARSTSLTVSSTVENSDALAEVGALHLAEDFEASAGVMAGRHDRTGFYGNLVVFLSFDEVNSQIQARYRELSKQGSGSNSNSGNTNNNSLLGSGSRTGQLTGTASIGKLTVEAGRDWQRGETDTNTRVTDHLRFEWPLMRGPALELRASLEATRGQNNNEQSTRVLMGLTLSHRQDGRDLTLQHTRQENRQKQSQNGQSEKTRTLSMVSRASARWQNLHIGKQTVRAGGFLEKQREQRSIGADANFSNRWFGGQVALNRLEPDKGEDVTSYIGNFSTSVLARFDNLAVGGGLLSDSAVIVELEGDTPGQQAGRFDILVNGRVAGKGRTGDSVPIILAPFYSYGVSIRPSADNFSDYDETAQEVTLYPGNVARVNFEIVSIEPVIGRLYDRDGKLIDGALLENSQDQAVTDIYGMFQSRLRPGLKELQVRLQDGSLCSAALPDERRRRRGVVLLGRLVCQ